MYPITKVTTPRNAAKCYDVPGKINFRDLDPQSHPTKSACKSAGTLRYVPYIKCSTLRSRATGSIEGSVGARYCCYHVYILPAKFLCLTIRFAAEHNSQTNHHSFNKIISSYRHIICVVCKQILFGFHGDVKLVPLQVACSQPSYCKQSYGYSRNSRFL
jgi:hypothetical protein